MIMVLNHTANTAALTGANLVCVFDIKLESETGKSVLAIYKPHPDAEFRYTTHVFSADEKPSDREFGVNEVDGYCLATLLVNLKERYGAGVSC